MNTQDSSRLIALLEENLQGQQGLLTQLYNLRASEHKYRTILEELDLGYMEVDVKGIIRHVHPRFLSMTGYSSKDLLGKSGDLLLDEEGKKIMDAVIEARKRGDATSYEIPIRHRLGHRIWFLITGAPIRDLDGRVTGSVGIHFDITERKMLELETKRALAAEELARQRERDLLMKMSHEIRTPINAINGMFRLLDGMKRKPEEEALWQGAQRASAMLRQVIDEVLALTKLEAGSQAVHRTKVKVIEVTRGLVEMHHLIAEEQGVPLECDCQLHNENRSLDVDKWLQILTNLLSNAIKYSEKGKVVLDIWEEENRPDWIYASVSDEGPGISKERRELIFEPFQGMEKEELSELGSTGLGLPIARELALVMGGDLRLVPSEKGAKFILELPAATWSEREESQGDDGEAQTPVPDWDGSGIRVLLAEDNELNILYAKALLNRWNIDFTLVGDGVEALEALENEAFDLVLLDIQMPRMNGLEALQRIRASEEEKGEKEVLPIYMVTAFADEESRSRADAEGATGYLVKPFTPESLSEVLRSVKD